jgi:hypothetical protein
MPCLSPAYLQLCHAYPAASPALLSTLLYPQPCLALNTALPEALICCALSPSLLCPHTCYAVPSILPSALPSPSLIPAYLPSVLNCHSPDIPSTLPCAAQPSVLQSSCLPCPLAFH